MAASPQRSRGSLLEECEELLSELPQTTMQYAFAYGSGAFQQKGEDMSEKMLDFIIAVRDPVMFHRENLVMNRHHYSLISLVGPVHLARYQTRLAARVFYNTHCKIRGRTCKYGVISTDDLRTDLLDWRWLYVAGRLHKPVLEVIAPPESLATAVEENRRSAVQTALLLLPDAISTRELLREIVGLSYTGDFRMVVGEDKKKVDKIVDGQYDALMKVYSPLLAEDARLVVNGERIEQDGSTTAIMHRLNLLPFRVQERLQSLCNRHMQRSRDSEEVLFSLAHRHDVSQHVSRAIRSVVAPVAFNQSMKNMVTAGISRSLIYSAAKLSKMLKK